jgi:hypothetical protein
MSPKINEKIAKYLVKYISIHEIYSKLFKHHKQKYSPQKLFEALLYKLESGIAYNNIDVSKFNIKGGTLYYFHKIIIKNKILTNFYHHYVNIYINQNHENINEFYVDTTLIANKLGVDKISYNIQLQKHKSTKISLIEDNFKVPIDIIITNSNVHDANICLSHITNITNKHEILCTNKNKLIADAAYDSKKIVEQLKQTKFGILISDKNKRNTKDPQKIKNLEPTLIEKLLLKKRSSIEHTNNSLKQNKNINVRYDKNAESYESFVILGIIKLIFKIIGPLK